MIELRNTKNAKHLPQKHFYKRATGEVGFDQRHSAYKEVQILIVRNRLVLELHTKGLATCPQYIGWYKDDECLVDPLQL